MLKRIIALFITAVFLALCGCSGKTSDYEEPENRIYISALGFDRKEKMLSVTAEAISVAGNTAGDQYSVTRYKGEGKSVESAMLRMKNDLAGLVNLSHCALVLMGENLSAEDLAQITEYCFSHKEITQSVQVAICPEAGELLKGQRKDGKPLGFLISDRLMENPDGVNSRRDTTLISVMNKRREADVYCLPYFRTESKQCLHRGWRMFEGDRSVYRLSRTEMQLLGICEGDFGGGEILWEDSPEALPLAVSRVRTDAELDDTAEGVLNIYVKITTDSKVHPSAEASVSREATRLINKILKKGLDPLQLESLIKAKHPDLQKGEIGALMSKARVSVECTVKEVGR